MNKGPGGKQVMLCNSWYVDQMGMYHIQPMWYLGSKGEQIPKEIQRVLTERGLWPATGLNLECPKPKCYNCQIIADCKLCIKGTRCQTCREKNITVPLVDLDGNVMLVWLKKRIVNV